MYKIIGSDGKEYGPISGEQLRQWIAQGRVNPQTKAKTENSTDWQPLNSLPEFAAELTSPTATLPPLTGAGTTPPKTSGLAITSLVLGILGLFTCGITALVGLILGIVALVKIKNSQGRLSGNGLAIGGIVTSAIFLLMVPIYVAMLLPALAKAKGRAHQINCVNNVKQLDLALIMFANDNTNQFPSATTWCDSLKTYVVPPKVFLCPLGKPTDRCHYAFNALLAGQDLSKIQNPSTLVTIFESDGGWNQSGGVELINQKRHAGKFAVGFADGHVETVRADRLGQLRWEP